MRQLRFSPVRKALLAAAMALVLPLSASAQGMQNATELTNTLSGLSAAPTQAAQTSNISALQAKLASVNAQISTATTAAQATQLRAVAKALQAIIGYVQSGYTLTGYSTTTDVATLDVTVSITLTAANGTTTATYNVVIPSLYDSTEAGDEDAAEEDEGSTSDFDPADILTQILQQVGQQMAGQLPAAQNPMSGIQGLLNGMVDGSGMPQIPTTLPEALSQAAAAAMQCMPDGTKVAAKPGVAVFDISAGKVYLPNGEVLNANSGLGAMMNNPAYVNRKNMGPTPPNVYNLSMRESTFHGYEAIRLNPTPGSTMYGRDGILAHPPLRANSLGSQGCVAIPDYGKFLAAFKRGEIKQIVVVPSTNASSQNCAPPAYNTPNPTS